MAFANTLADNLVADGGVLFRGAFTTTNLIRTKVLDNHAARREKTSLYCSSSQAGTWVIYDVDETGEARQIISIAVLADELSIYTHNHVAFMILCTFEPSVAPGNLTIRAYTSGYGARS